MAGGTPSDWTLLDMGKEAFDYFDDCRETKDMKVWEKVVTGGALCIALPIYYVLNKLDYWAYLKKKRRSRWEYAHTKRANGMTDKEADHLLDLILHERRIDEAIAAAKAREEWELMVVPDTERPPYEPLEWRNLSK